MRQKIHAKRSLDDAIAQNEEKVTAARAKIAAAKEALEQDKADGKMTDEEYAAKQAKIKAAEEAVNALEEKVRSGQRFKGEN